MFVRESGNGGARVVLFLHPLGPDHRFWAAQENGLQDCLTLAPDLPGFGRSRLELTGLDAAVGACAALLSERGAATVVGVSYGGYVAALLAAAHPDLVSGLALSGVRRQIPRPLARLQAAAFLGVRKRALARDETIPNSALASERRNLVAASLELGRVDLRPVLPRIAAPTVVFAPERDWFTRREVPHLVALIPDARVVRVPAAGHLWPQDRPEPLTSVVRAVL